MSDSINEWQMGQSWYMLVAKQMDICLVAQSLAKEDATMYDEWYTEIRKLSAVVGNLFKESDYAQIYDRFNEAEKVMGFDTNFSFSLDLKNDAEKRYAVDRALSSLQNWLIRTAYQNKLLIPTSKDYSHVPIGARNR